VHELNATQANKILTEYHLEQKSFAKVMELEPDEIIRRSEVMLTRVFKLTKVGEQIFRSAEDDINNSYYLYLYLVFICCS
jgi:hypothetical protein